jgi:hypothetical protein
MRDLKGFHVLPKCKVLSSHFVMTKASEKKTSIQKKRLFLFLPFFIPLSLTHTHTHRKSSLSLGSRITSASLSGGRYVSAAAIQKTSEKTEKIEANFSNEKNCREEGKKQCANKVEGKEWVRVRRRRSNSAKLEGERERERTSESPKKQKRQQKIREANERKREKKLSIYR